MSTLVNPRSVRLGLKNNYQWVGSSKFKNNDRERLLQGLYINEFVQTFFLKKSLSYGGFYFKSSWIYYQKDKTVVLIKLVDMGAEGMNAIGRLEEVLQEVEFELNSLIGSEVVVKIVSSLEDILNPRTVVRFCKILLEKEMGIGDIIFRLRAVLARGVNKLKKVGINRGYKIIIKGRFSRKQRAGKVKIEYGGLQKSTLRNKVDFSNGEAIVRYGVCNIQVWISDSYINKEIKK
jgi:ribosomal protein S3